MYQARTGLANTEIRVSYIYAAPASMGLFVLIAYVYFQSFYQTIFSETFVLSTQTMV